MKQKSKKWHLANKERSAEINKGWATKNPERAREVWREMKARQRKDPIRRAVMAVRTSVASSLKRGAKQAATFDAVGYSKDELIAHIERQFVKGMSWSNYGEWHIDHIVPLSAFDIRRIDSDEFRAAWALSNLRPLWGKDNMQKRDKRIYLI